MIRWGIIGLGNIAARFSKSLSSSSNGKLYAVSSRNKEKCEKYEKLYPGCISYLSYDDIISDDNVDAIYIALPHGMHMEWALKALSHKKAVLCEKPATINEEQVMKIVDCAKANQTFFMEAMKSRFGLGIKKIKEELKNGAIGEIKSISANFCEAIDSVVIPMNAYYYDRGQGGTLLDMGPYPIAFFMDILGDQVCSIESIIKVNNIGIDIHINGTLFYQTGQTASFEVCFDETKERMAMIEGTDGKMIIPYYYRTTEYSIIGNDMKTRREEYPLQVDDMFGEIEEVHRCLNAGLIESPNFTWQDSISEMHLLDRIRSEGKIIQMK
ncbi:MAG: Gfo/Idh/MocA family oxidoreductase [Herbinix sp.]|nr:Gfo/Idh/MocA family oxidoreductase [Herbinix sp.]